MQYVAWSRKYKEEHDQISRKVMFIKEIVGQDDRIIGLDQKENMIRWKKPV